MKLHHLLPAITLLFSFSAAHAQFNLNLNQLGSGLKSLGTAATGIGEPEEIAIGRDLAGRLLGQIALVDDPNVQAYVNRVGRWIASQSERPDIPWRFGVANAANINAMAMPGGTILITRGLYEILDNEAQLAGVLGHEIAHVVKRHHIEVMRKQNLLVGLTDIASSGRGGGGVLKQAALDSLKKIFISGLDKDSEYEADAVGEVLAARAGYNAFGLAEVLHKLAARAGGDAATADLFGSHPGPADRLEKLGEKLSPRVGTLPNGLKPQITPVSASAAAPTQNAAPVAGSRGFTNEAGAKPAAAPAGASTIAPSGGGSNPLDAVKGLRGLFGR